MGDCGCNCYCACSSYRDESENIKKVFKNPLPNLLKINNYFLIMLSDERSGDRAVDLQDENYFTGKMPNSYHYFVRRKGVEIDGKVFLIDEKYVNGLELNKL